MSIESQGKIRLVRILDQATCLRTVRSDRSEDDWQPGKLYADGGIQEQWSRSCSIIAETHAAGVLAETFAQVRAALSPLCLRDGRRIFSLSALNMIRYRPGDRFLPHRDAVPGSANWRRHSIVCYLNSDFDGGETYFPNIDLIITPRIGFALLFPSYFLHEGRGVTSGIKFIINGFFIDPNSSE